MIFEIEAPDGRLLRQQAASSDALKAALLPDYRLVGRVFGADAAGNGGMVHRTGEPSLLAELLEAAGDDLRAWLELHFKAKAQ